VTVRLLIYSGRPDPSWSLDETAITDLRRRLQQTIGGERAPQPGPEGLGYRGLLVENSARVAGLPAAFTVFRGVLSEPSRERGNHWQDRGGVESWLLAEARARGHGEALDALGVSGGPARR